MRINYQVKGWASSFRTPIIKPGPSRTLNSSTVANVLSLADWKLTQKIRPSARSSLSRQTTKPTPRSARPNLWPEVLMALTRSRRKSHSSLAQQRARGNRHWHRLHGWGCPIQSLFVVYRAHHSHLLPVRTDKVKVTPRVGTTPIVFSSQRLMTSSGVIIRRFPPHRDLS